MDRNAFQRVRISALFIISFAGMLLHMSSATLGEVAGLFGWGGELMTAMKAEGATLAAAAGAAELPEHEAMNTGLFYVVAVWFFLMLVPAVLPLLSDQKVLRWVTFGFGVLMTLGGLLDNALHMGVAEEAPFGLAGMLASTVPGVFGVVFAFGWAKGGE